jgi:hypothetical protein
VLAAVADDRLTGDQPGVVGREERDEPCEVRELHSAPDRLPTHRRVERLLVGVLTRAWVETYPGITAFTVTLRTITALLLAR